jgi:hypothetical protein
VIARAVGTKDWEATAKTAKTETARRDGKKEAILEKITVLSEKPFRTLTRK